MTGGLDLGKQIGPLPLGAWIGVVGTGLGVALWTRSQSTDTGGAGDSYDSTGGGGLSTNGGGLAGEDGVGIGPGWVAVPPPTSAPQDTPPQDNDEWGRLAINYLIAQGYDPAKSQSAIGRALQGTTMSVSEYALWGIALRKLGAPPYPVDVVPPVSVPGPVTQPPPPPPPKPAPPKGRWYVITPNMTLRKVSIKFWGRTGFGDDVFRVNAKGVARPKGVLPYPNPSPGWMTNRNPDNRLPVGRILFIPK